MQLKFSSALVVPLAFSTLAFSTLAGCGLQGATSHQSQLYFRNLNQSEALSDFDQMVSLVKSYYGPLTFKEQKYGFKLDGVANQARTELRTAKTDSEIFGIYKKFLSHLKDAHVNIEFGANSNPYSRTIIPIQIDPVENSAIVTSMAPKMAELGIALGDELLKVDGQKPFDVAAILRKYETMGNDLSDRHLIGNVLVRPFYITELAPKTAIAELEFKRANGSIYTVKTPWANRPMFKPSTIPNASVSVFDGLLKHGLHNKRVGELKAIRLENEERAELASPFFITEPTLSSYQFTPVTPDDASLRRFNVDPTSAPEIFAATYTHAGKRVLLIRQDTYGVENIEAMLQTYKALLSQFEATTDVLVIDQNQNPGGALGYALGFVSLFINKPIPNFVQKMHADRGWLQAFKSFATQVPMNFAQILLARAAIIEKAYDEGRALTEPMPLDGDTQLYPDIEYTWKKPVMILADEMAASCGDLVPMLLSRSGTAKFFGQTTMGAGGTVEGVGVLSYSGATLSLTRGLYTTYRSDGRYTDDDLVENKGVTPDFVYSPTMADVRGGYLNYVKAFSDKAVQIVR